jgi:hypothetical protein
MSKKLSGEEGMSPLERGRRRYLNKDFAGALEAFTEVGSLNYFLISHNFFSRHPVMQ